jgi:excisionase family DNA binding protein
VRKEKMLTAKEFAKETGISYPVVVKWLKDGTIPAERVVNIWQIPSSLVARFMKPERRPKPGRPKKAAKK